MQLSAPSLPPSSELVWCAPSSVPVPEVTQFSAFSESSLVQHSQAVFSLLVRFVPHALLFAAGSFALRLKTHDETS